jgi:hypothetical protein
VNLAETQSGLHDLLRGKPISQGDDYLDDVRASDRLDLLREIVEWWRVFGVERTAPLTARLLKRRGRFDEAVSRFVAEQRMSPYLEEIGERFAANARKDPDALVAAVASFEWAFMRVKRGDGEAHSVPWPVEPYAVLEALISGGPLPSIPSGGPSFLTRISSEIRGTFVVERVAQPTR